jgi:hypothetical protein
MIQGDAAWFAVRCGRATASCFADVLATIKTGEAAARRNYKAQLVCERLTGIVAESYTNAAMAWGTEQEPAARAAYEAMTGNLVEQVAFVPHTELMAGASPDGLIDDDGGLEIKCPNSAQHIDALLKGMPPEHIPQIQGCMWLTGRKWWDFVSFDPRLRGKLQLHIQRIERDDIYIAKLALAVGVFLGEVDDLVAQLEKKAA